MAIAKQMAQPKPLPAQKSSSKDKAETPKKPANKANDEPDSWATLSGFKEQSTLQSRPHLQNRTHLISGVYKPDRDAADVKEGQKCSTKQAVETEMSDATNLHTNASSDVVDNSLYQDFKEKKQVSFCLKLITSSPSVQISCSEQRK